MRSPTTMRIAGALLVCSMLATTLHAQAQRDITPDDIIDAPAVLDVQLSPSGHDVLYEVRHTLRDENRYLTELWVRAADGSAPARRLAVSPHNLSQYQSLRAQWAPDSRSVVYFATLDGKSRLMRFTLASSREEVLLDQSWSADNPRYPRTQFCKFSPDGRTLAFAAVETLPPPDTENHGEVSGPQWPRPLHEPRATLWLYDIATKTAKQMTQPTYHVSDIAWSPDGKRIAFSAAPTRADAPYKDDLYLLDVESGAITPLVQQPGWDHEPVWSPDGKTIAFVSQRGDQDYNYNAWVALVPAQGGKPRYLFDEFQKQSGSGPASVIWTADGRSLLFSTLYHFGRHVFQGSIATDKVRQVTPAGPYYTHFSFSADARRIALAIENVTTPADVYVGTVPWHEPRKLTDLHPGWSAIRQAHVTTTKWRSRDDRFDLEGVVIEPPDYQPGRRYPTLVYLPGGPSMVRTGFVMDEAIYAFPVFAARGYVVFVPMNRGRGGFGKALRQAQPDDVDPLPGPFADAMAGVDDLIARGIADPEKLAVTGFSFGGSLASYTITHTTRFKAAGINEGYCNLLRTTLRAAGSEHRVELLKDQIGVGSPWDPVARKVIWNNSSIYFMDRVKTPTLLEFGSESAAHDEGNELYNALRFFKVPSLYVVYPHSGHGLDAPKLYADSYARQLAWFDYWLLGKGEDPTRAAEVQ